MNEENLIKMSLEDIPRFINDDDPELAIARCLFLSTRPNSHGFTIPENVLTRDAKTILGKFLVGNLNIFESDVTTHLKEPDIFGYMPMEQEIEFVRAEDGYLDAYVNAVISKVYATKVYDLFVDDNFRNVSVEMRLGYSDEENKIVDHFNVCGLTILGKKVNPSVPHANMEIVKFSAEQAEKYYSKMASSNNFETEVLSKLNSIFNKLNLNETDNNEEHKESEMAKLEEQENGVVMENPTEEVKQEAENKEEEVKLSENANKDSEEKASEENAECADPKENEKPADNNEDDEAEKASEDSNEEEDDKLAKSEAHCAELEAKCSELEAKLSELEKFKADTENKEKMSIVTQTLAQVKESMDEETYAKFEAKANDCDINTINAWRNEVLANVATVLMSKQGNDESHLRMDVEISDNAPKGLWDRM